MCSSPSLTTTGRARGRGTSLCPVFTADRRASSRSYVVFWVSPQWSHSFPGRHRSPLGLAPFVIDTPSVDVMGHARQASSTYARFDRLDIASGGRQRPSHFHPIVDTHPHTHTPIFSTQSSLVVTHAYTVGTGVLVRRSAATSALGRSAAVRERRSLRGAAQRSSGDDHVGLSFQNQRSPREPDSTSSLPQHEVESVAEA